MRTDEIPELFFLDHDRPVLKSYGELRAAQDALTAAKAWAAQAGATLQPQPLSLVHHLYIQERFGIGEAGVTLPALPYSWRESLLSQL